MHLIKVVAVFAVLGIVVAYTTPEEWSSRIELMPEISTPSVTGGGSLQKLAGLAGVNLNTESTGILSPVLYPQITGSYVFKAKLLDEAFYFSNIEDTVTLREYFMEHSKGSLINRVIALPKDALAGIMTLIKGEKEEQAGGGSDSEDRLFYYTEDEKAMFEQIDERLSVSIDETTGIVKISAIFQDRIAAAMIVNYTYDYLADYISNYNTEKEIRTLDFLTEQLAKSEEEYEDKQTVLAKHIDGNRNLITEQSRTKQLQLQREVDLSFSLLSSLAQQVQETQVTVEEKKPVFTVLRPAAVAAVRSKPKRFSILFLSMLLGGLLASARLFYIRYIKS